MMRSDVSRRPNVNVLTNDRLVTFHGSWQRYGHVFYTTTAIEIIKFLRQRYLNIA